MRFFSDIDVRLEKAAGRIGKNIQNALKPLTPMVTGSLRSTVAVGKPVRKGNVLEIEIAMADYGIWLNEGTGIFGKYKRRIFPKEKKALKTPFGVFKSVKGIEGRHFVEKAIEEVYRSGEMEEEIVKAFR